MDAFTIETKLPDHQVALLRRIEMHLLRIESGDEYLTRYEAAKFVKADVTTLDRWRSKPKFASNPFPIAHYGGSDPRFLRSELIEWMRRNGELEILKQD